MADKIRVKAGSFDYMGNKGSGKLGGKSAGDIG